VREQRVVAGGEGRGFDAERVLARRRQLVWKKNKNEIFLASESVFDATISKIFSLKTIGRKRLK
jgi:hypothetical protein